MVPLFIVSDAQVARSEGSIFPEDQTARRLRLTASIG